MFLVNGADMKIITMSLLDDIKGDKIYLFAEKSIDVLNDIKSKK